MGKPAMCLDLNPIEHVWTRKRHSIMSPPHPSTQHTLNTAIFEDGDLLQKNISTPLFPT